MIFEQENYFRKHNILQQSLHGKPIIVGFHQKKEKKKDFTNLTKGLIILELTFLENSGPTLEQRHLAEETKQLSSASARNYHIYELVFQIENI